MKFGLRLVFLSTFTWIILSCNRENKENELKHYAGPMLVSKHLNTIYTDSGRIKLRMEAPVQVEFSNGNQEYEKGMTVNFYQKDGTIKSYLKADFVHYNKGQDLYTAIGNVVLEDLVDKQQLRTQKLHWSKFEGKVFNNEYVEITTPTQILKGKGLTALQDFSSYTILEPEGQILHADSADFF